MTVLTDTDAPRRLRAMRNACSVMLGVTAAGFTGEIAAYFSLTVCCLVWLSMALDKASQLKVYELAEDERVTKQIVKVEPKAEKLTWEGSDD